MLFLSEVFEAVAVVVACLTSLLKLSTEPSGKSVSLHLIYKPNLATGLAKSVKRSTAERKVTGSIPGVGPILWV